LTAADTFVSLSGSLFLSLSLSAFSPTATTFHS
jgi:hypothetical protein